MMHRKFLQMCALGLFPVLIRRQSHPHRGHGWKELDGTSDGTLHQSKGSEGTGTCNVLFYDHGTGLATVDGVKRTSLVIDPPDGKIPAFTRAARTRNRPDGLTTADDRAQDRPLSERCLIGFGSSISYS